MREKIWTFIEFMENRTLNNMEKVIGIDASLYQKRINFKTLQDNGVSFVILKASSGSGIDPLFKQHMAEAEYGPNIVIGAYHWCDPTFDDNKQAQMFLDIVQPYDRVKFYAGDAEQWWADWVMWGKMTRNECRPDDVPHLTGQRMNDNIHNILNYWSARTDRKVLIYTAKWWTDYYAPLTSGWIKDYPLWVATYPTVTKAPTSWKEYFDTQPPAGTSPYMPRGSEKWTIWQNTGNLKLPGVYTDDKETTISAADGNIFNGNQLQFDEFFKVVHVPTLEERVKKLEDLAIDHGWMLSEEVKKLVNS